MFVVFFCVLGEEHNLKRCPCTFFVAVLHWIIRLNKLVLKLPIVLSWIFNSLPIQQLCNYTLQSDTWLILHIEPNMGSEKQTCHNTLLRIQHKNREIKVANFQLVSLPLSLSRSIAHWFLYSFDSPYLFPKWQNIQINEFTCAQIICFLFVFSFVVYYDCSICFMIRKWNSYRTHFFLTR